MLFLKIYNFASLKITIIILPLIVWNNGFCTLNASYTFPENRLKFSKHCCKYNAYGFLSIHYIYTVCTVHNIQLVFLLWKTKDGMKYVEKKKRTKRGKEHHTFPFWSGLYVAYTVAQQSLVVIAFKKSS